MENRAVYEAIIASMQGSLKGVVLVVLHGHQGREQAIGRGQLVKEVNALGLNAHERNVRETIRRLRRDGVLVCAMPGEGGGYYLATSMEEFADWVRQEYRARIVDMLETVRVMERSAEKAFETKSTVQLSFFENMRRIDNV